MKPIALLSCGIATLFLLAHVWPLHVLTLRDIYSDSCVFARAVSPGDRFSLSYTHSVKWKRVLDFYVVGEYYEIVQYKTVFPGSDFGLPSAATGQESYTSLHDGNNCISGMRQKIPSLLLRIEPLYDNILTFKENSELNLSRSLGDCVLEMRIQNMSPLFYAYLVLIRVQ